jgi:hypothetical protein
MPTLKGPENGWFTTEVVNEGRVDKSFKVIQTGRCHLHGRA